MALSDYDMLAFGPDGKPSDGCLQGFIDGDSVEIYKTKLYIRSQNMWHEGYGFVEPTIMEVMSGKLSIANFKIVATRGLSGELFSVVEVHDYNSKPPRHKYMGGIGCYGWDDPTERVAKELGVDLSNYDNVMHSTGWANGKHNVSLYCMKDGVAEPDLFRRELESREERDKLDARYTGVTQEMWDEYCKWVENEVLEGDYYIGTKNFEEWWVEVKKNEPRRFSQGDGFFVDNLGGGDKTEEAGTKIGEAQEPWLTQALRRMGD